MTPECIIEAARLWNLGMDTVEITTRLRRLDDDVREWNVYSRMPSIRAAAMAMRHARRRA